MLCWSLKFSLYSFYFICTKNHCLGLHKLWISSAQLRVTGRICQSPTALPYFQECLFRQWVETRLGFILLSHPFSGLSECLLCDQHKLGSPPGCVRSTISALQFHCGWSEAPVWGLWAVVGPLPCILSLQIQLASLLGLELTTGDLRVGGGITDLQGYSDTLYPMIAPPGWPV